MRKIIFLACMLPGWVLAQQTIERFYIDRLHSSVNFNLKYIEIMELTGRADDYFGEFLYNPDDLSQSKVHFVVKTSSLNTAMINRDIDLHSSEFMHTKEFPALIFRSKQLFMRKGELYFSGTLTIKDVSKPMELPFQIVAERQDKKKKLMVIKAGPITIKRSDFGIGVIETMIDKIFLGDEVKIWADLLFTSERPEENELRVQYPTVQLTSAQLENFEGIYENESGTQWQVEKLGGRLFFILGDAAVIKALVPIGNDSFIVAEDGFLLNFQRDQNDGITGVTLKLKSMSIILKIIK